MKMKCPYCNEETGNLSGKCPVCGEKIPLCATLKEIFQQAFSKLKENKKTVLISVDYHFRNYIRIWRNKRVNKFACV